MLKIAVGGPDTNYEINRYYWLNVKFKEGEQGTLTYGTANIENNKIMIDLDIKDLKSREILLSEKLIDFKKEVSIILNGDLKIEKKFSKSQLIKESIIKSYKDSNFIFENKVKLEF